MTEATAAPAAPDATAAPAAAPAAPAPPTDWTAGLDAATKSFIQARGFKAPADLMTTLQSYDPPESPDKYEIPVPEGDPGEFAKKVAPLLHGAKLSTAQAKALAEGWNALNATEAKAAQEAATAQAREAEAVAKRQESELKAEWGAQYEANVETARRAIRAGMGAAGLQDEQAASMIDTLEKTHGFASVHKFFAALGGQFKEASAHGMNMQPSPPATAFYPNSKMNP